MRELELPVFLTVALNLNFYTRGGHAGKLSGVRLGKPLQSAKGYLLSRRDSMVLQSVQAAGPEDWAARGLKSPL